MFVFMYFFTLVKPAELHLAGIAIPHGFLETVEALEVVRWL
jgi:hypothetical protein